MINNNSNIRKESGDISMPTDEMIKIANNLKITDKSLNTKSAYKAAEDGTLKGLR